MDNSLLEQTFESIRRIRVREDKKFKAIPRKYTHVLDVQNLSTVNALEMDPLSPRIEWNFIYAKMLRRWDT